MTTISTTNVVPGFIPKCGVSAGFSKKKPRSKTLEFPGFFDPCGVMRGYFVHLAGEEIRKGRQPEKTSYNGQGQKTP